MSSTTDKIKGMKDQAVGAVKQGIGKVTGSDDMKIKGAAQQIKGKAEVASGKVKDAVKDAVARAADKVNKKLSRNRVGWRTSPHPRSSCAFALDDRGFFARGQPLLRMARMSFLTGPGFGSDFETAPGGGAFGGALGSMISKSPRGP